MSMGHRRKKRFIEKEIYQKSSYGSNVPSETYPLPHTESSRVYLDLERRKSLVFMFSKKSVLYNVLSKILLIFYQCAINCLMFSYNVFMWEIRFIYWISFRNMTTWVGHVIVLAQWKTPFPGLCCISWEVKIFTLQGK